jgi:hypothetical protein
MEDNNETVTEPVVDEPNQSDSEAALADPGKRALAAERRRAAAAESTAKALQARLDELSAAQLSKEEKALKDASDAEDRAAKAEAEALRWRIAARNSISDDDAELFLTGSDEETLTRQAERFKQLSYKPSTGNYVPGVGNQPSTPASIADRIAVAESQGDHKTALTLKAQQLSELARANR